MKKMINVLLHFMFSIVVCASLHADMEQEVQEAHRLIDEYVASLSVEEQEEFKKNRIELEIELVKRGESLLKGDQFYILKQIVEEAKNIVEGSFEFRLAAKKRLALLVNILMNFEQLDKEIKNTIQEDIVIIQQARGKLITPDVFNAYKNLLKVTSRVMDPSKTQQVMDYISDKFQDIKNAVRRMWYGSDEIK